MKKGVFIALEGTDGSGKGTQTKLLVEKLSKKGHPAVSISFPQYASPSSCAVSAILKGQLSEKATEMHPKRASLAFAFDRAMHARTIRNWLREGLVVVADRYVDSNAAHQGGKIKDPAKRKEFLQWLYGLEYVDLEIPRPDLVLVLDVVPEVANKLIDLKNPRAHLDGAERDEHEKNFQHIVDSYHAYKWIVEHFVDGRHRLVDCMKDGKIKTEAEVHNLIWGEADNFLKTFFGG